MFGSMPQSMLVALSAFCWASVRSVRNAGVAGNGMPPATDRIQVGQIDRCAEAGVAARGGTGDGRLYPR